MGIAERRSDTAGYHTFRPASATDDERTPRPARRKRTADAERVGHREPGGKVRRDRRLAGICSPRPLRGLHSRARCVLRL